MCERRPWQFLAVVAAMLALVACDRDPHDATAHDRDETSATGAAPASAAPTNRIDIPAAVRDNLGITFAKVERRAVAATLRVPGRFELTPDARREYHASLAGHVELLVRQYEPVQVGQLVARVESPEWHRLRVELGEDQQDVVRAEAELAVAEQTLAEARESVAILEKRIAALDDAGVRRAELDAELATRRSSLPRLEAEILAKRAALESARHHLPLAMAAAASQLGMTAEQLAEPVPGPDGTSAPRWKTIDRIELKAAAPGVVETLAVTNGAWVEQAATVLTTIDPAAVRFRAVGLQSDLAKLRDGLPAAVVPPRGGTNGQATPVSGELKLAPLADPQQRTVDLLMTPRQSAEWVRPGVSAFLEITTDGSDAEPAIPVAAVIQDGLEQVFFRRDPKDPDKVIRTAADLGVSDGRWVVVESGIRVGDEVVIDGVYELKLATAGQSGGAGKGHFHADGTYHEGDDEKK